MTDVKNLYNNAVRGKDYETERWLASPLKKAGYEMTMAALRRHFLTDELNFSEYLEVGPGAGTWTKLFVGEYPNARFDLVDISFEMLELARWNLKNQGNVRYFEKDFLEYEPDKIYDIFFSSRALEYFPDKEKFISKVSSCLAPGGWGFIITKSPKYFRNKILGRKIGPLHQGQIVFGRLRQIMEKHGLSGIEIYPAAMYIPLLKSAAANRFAWRIFNGKKLNFFSNLFSESYCVKFSKK